MASRFEPVTDPVLAWEYRKAGLLYWRKWRDKYELTRDDWSGSSEGLRNQTERMQAGYNYAILVEDD